jgi:hypothetical protein
MTRERTDHHGLTSVCEVSGEAPRSDFGFQASGVREKRV